jgi:hypothetical protein
MTNKKIQDFIERNNCTHLFLLLTNEELKRLSKLPFQVRQQFKGKLTTIAMEHVAEGNIPDYFVPEEEKPEGKISDIIDE